LSLRDLAAAATPGPWYRTPHSAHVFADDPEDGNAGVDVAQCEENDDARLIALAPELAVLAADMADLLSVIALSFAGDQDTKRSELLARFRDLEARAHQDST
jgi:hypothetical protein